MKSGFWKKDWFLGLIVSLVLLFAGATQFIQGLERAAYDWGVRASTRASSDKVVVIAIDDVSIRNIGRWPWSRDVHAKMTESLVGAKAKVIGNLVFFSEPQVDAGLVYINKLLEIFGKYVPGPDGEPAAATGSAELIQLGTMLREAEEALNTDRKLAQSYTNSKNVLLPMLFELGEPRGRPDKPLPEFVTRNKVPKVDQGTGDAPLPASSVISLPIDSIGNSAAAIGHLNANVDVDGGIRTEPLIVQFFDQYYPSMSMMLAAKSLNLGPEDIKVSLGQGVQIGKLRIATDSALQMNTFFYKDQDSRSVFRVDSFFDVYSGKIKPETFQDKIVLIGPTAAGVGTTSVTPISPAMAPVLTLAHSVSSILQEHFFVVPSWGVRRGETGLRADCRLSDCPVAPPEGRYGGERHAGIGRGDSGRPFCAYDRAGLVVAVDAGPDAAGNRPRAIGDQTLRHDRGGQGKIGSGIGGFQPHAGPGVSGAGAARYGVRLLSQDANGRSGDGQLV